MNSTKQDDLRTIAKFTKAIGQGTGDHGASRPDYKVDVAAMELGGLAVGVTHAAYAEVENRCLAAKANMVKACVAMLAEVETLDTAAKKAVGKLNDVSGRVAQSLAKTKEIMGPNVEDRLRQLERLVDCMERLNALNTDGVVDRFATALKGKQS